MPSAQHRKKKQKTASNAALSQAEIWDDSALIRSWNEALEEYEFYHSIHAKGEDIEEILRRAEMGELGDEDGEILGDGQCKEDSGQKSLGPELSTAPAPARGVEESADEGEIVDEDGDAPVQVDENHGQDHDRLLLEQRREQAMRHLNSASDQQANGQPSLKPKQQQKQAHPPPLTPGGTTAAAADHGAPNATTNGSASTQPLASQQDQTLENVKMAYYWAGYYSGLYDGQRQAQNQP